MSNTLKRRSLKTLGYGFIFGAALTTISFIIAMVLAAKSIEVLALTTIAAAANSSPLILASIILAIILGTLIGGVLVRAAKRFEDPRPASTEEERDTAQLLAGANTQAQNEAINPELSSEKTNDAKTSSEEVDGKPQITVPDTTGPVITHIENDAAAKQAAASPTNKDSGGSAGTASPEDTASINGSSPIPQSPSNSTSPTSPITVGQARVAGVSASAAIPPSTPEGARATSPSTGSTTSLTLDSPPKPPPASKTSFRSNNLSNSFITPSRLAEELAVPSSASKQIVPKPSSDIDTSTQPLKIKSMVRLPSCGHAKEGQPSRSITPPAGNLTGLLGNSVCLFAPPTEVTIKDRPMKTPDTLRRRTKASTG